MSKFIEKKIIKASKRGITFSFWNKTNDNHLKTEFDVGDKYIIDLKNKKMVILPSDNGLTVSKKRVNNEVKPLFDIRNAKTLQAFEGSEYLEVTIFNDKILVEGFNTTEKEFSDKDSSISSLLNVEKVASTCFNRNEFDEIFDNLPGEVASYKYPMQVVSLFSGSGIFDYGFELENFEIVFAIDSNKAATETYKANLGEHIVCGDICSFPKEKVPQAKIIIGGPSCRPFSLARCDYGTHKGKIENHPDCRLIYEYTQWINSEYADYDIFVMENVPGLLTANNGLYLELIKNELPGYEITYGIVNDLEQGGYQNRNRAIIIGSKIGKVNIPTPKVKREDFKTFGDALKLVDETWYNYSDVSLPREDTLNRMRYVPQGGNFKNIPKELRTKAVHSNSYKRLALDEPCITLVNYRKPIIMHPIYDRILTVSEAAAATGLDKTFKFLGSLSAKQQQVGNSVPVNLGRSVAREVFNTIMKYVNKQLRLRIQSVV